MRKQNLCIFIFQKLFIIAVTDNTTDCFVKGCLMLRLSKTVKKDKISISVYNSFTMNIKKLLSFFFHKECFFDEIQHRDLAFASRRFRGIDIKIAATLTTVGSMVIIYQRMINIDNCRAAKGRKQPAMVAGTLRYRIQRRPNRYGCSVSGWKCRRSALLVLVRF